MRVFVKETIILNKEEVIEALYDYLKKRNTTHDIPLEERFISDIKGLSDKTSIEITLNEEEK